MAVPFLPAFDARPDTGRCRDAGMAFTLIALLFAWLGDVSGAVPAAVLILLINMIQPRVYRYPAALWYWLADVLGGVVSTVLLSAVFFLILTPMGLLRRAMGRDPMRLREWRRGDGTVFAERDRKVDAGDLEQMF